MSLISAPWVRLQHTHIHADSYANLDNKTTSPSSTNSGHEFIRAAFGEEYRVRHGWQSKESSRTWSKPPPKYNAVQLKHTTARAARPQQLTCSLATLA